MDCRAHKVGSLRNLSEINGPTEHNVISTFNDVDVLNCSKSRGTDGHNSQAMMSSLHRFTGDADVEGGHSHGARLSCIPSDPEDAKMITLVTQHCSLMHCSPTNATPPPLPSVNNLRQCRSFGVG